MKEFRVLHIVGSSMEITDQKVAVIDLAEVKRQDLGPDSDIIPYTFGSKGNKFIIDLNSDLTKRVIHLAQNEEIVELDMNDFVVKYDEKDGRVDKIYYHKNVELVEIKQEKTSMFEFSLDKLDDYTYLDLEGNYSPAQVDIALKDICIYLKSQVDKKDNFISENDGYLKISVAPYNRELTDNEKLLVSMRLMPINEVKVDSDGFDWEEIIDILVDIQDEFPDNFKSNFMYRVDFKNLTVKG